MTNELKTLSDAIRYFADEQTCIDTVAAYALARRPYSAPLASCLIFASTGSRNQKPLAVPGLRQTVFRQGEYHL